MRVVHATALTAAALLLASVASAQGLGDAAAREREKRKAAPPAKPAKVYTEGDIGSSMAPTSGADQPAAPADAAAGSPSSTAAAGEGKTEGASEKSAAQIEEEAKEAAQAAWRQQLEQARKDEAAYKDIVDRTQLQLNDTSGMYSPGYTAALASLEENKKKLAEVQGRIAALEEEGRRKLYR